MSEQLGEAYVKIGARLDALEQAFKAAKAKSQSAASAIGSAFKTAFAAIGADLSLRGGINFLESAFGSASDREKAVTGLQSALRLTGQYSDDANRRFEDLAVSLGKLPGVTENEVRQLAAMGVQSSRSAESAEEMVRQAVALKDRLGGASNAMKILAGEMNGQASDELSHALGHNLVNITDMGTRLRIVAAEARSGFQILTDNAGRFTSKTEMVGKTFEKLKAAIGDTFTNLVADNADKITAFLDGLREQIPLVVTKVKEFAEGVRAFFAPIGDFLKPGIEALKTLIGLAVEAAKAIGKVAGAIPKVSDAVGEKVGGALFGTGNKSAAAYKFDDILSGEQARRAQRIAKYGDRLGPAVYDTSPGQRNFGKSEKEIAAESRIPGKDFFKRIFGDLPKAAAAGKGRDGAPTGPLGRGPDIKSTPSSVQGIESFLQSLAQAGADSAAREQTDIARQQLTEMKAIREGLANSPSIRVRG